MKRAWTIVAVVVVLFSAGCSGSGPSAPELGPTSGRPEASHHRALAAAEIAHVLATIPVPPEATAHEPPDHGGRLDRLGCQCGEVDPSLTRTRWWTVPMSYRELVRWYGAHSPANLGSARFPDGSLSPHGELDWEVPADSTAYSTPAAVISYVRTGPASTEIRADATLAARYDRTAATFVPPTVTRIDITRTALGGPAHPMSASVTDPAPMTRIVSAFDHLSGAFAHTLPAGCGSPGSDDYVYALVFHWSGHSLAVDPGAPLCGVGMGLTLDGVELPQTLEDARALDAALRAAL